MVDPQHVAVRIREERLKTHAGIDRIALELDAARLELGLRRLEVVDAELERIRARLELESERIRLDDGDRQVAGLELVTGHVAPLLATLEPERLAVELHRPVDVGRADDEEVRAGNQCHVYNPNVFAMMFFWISDVPPKIVVTTAARRYCSIGYSVAYP